MQTLLAGVFAHAVPAGEEEEEEKEGAVVVGGLSPKHANRCREGCALQWLKVVVATGETMSHLRRAWA